MEDKVATFYVRVNRKWEETENDYERCDIIQICNFNGYYFAYGHKKNSIECYTMLCGNKRHDQVLADAIRLFDSIL